PTACVPSPRSWAEKTRTRRGCAVHRPHARTYSRASRRSSRDLLARFLRKRKAPVATEPKRHGNSAGTFGRRRKAPMKCKLKAGGLHPLRDRLGGETEPAVSVLVAQKLEIVRSEIHHQQTTGRTQHARRLDDGARSVVEKMQDLVKDHDVERILRQTEVV